MGLSDIVKSLIRAMEEFEIIDCHEHLHPEKVRLQAEVDVFTLFSHYTKGDLSVAGMGADKERLPIHDQSIPLDQRWEIFAPYWERIRYTSYSRAALLAAKKFFGFDDINEKTYQPLTEAIKKFNTPGLYERALRDACNIRTALTQCGSTETGSELLTPVMPMMFGTETWDSITNSPLIRRAGIQSMDDYLDAVREYMIHAKDDGAVGLKMMSNPYGAPDRGKALKAFENLRIGAVERLPVLNPLRDYIVDQTIAMAAEFNLVVAVHTGYWGDFRELDPLHMIPLLQRHPDARFDIYHLGYPWVRETLMLGKGFPNVWLNLCWTHIISQRFAMAGLDEAIDLVPMNKILAFGGDYQMPVEKVYGHLVMAREDIARVLARRIREGQFNEDQALKLAHKWFFDNPVELYRLKV